MVSTNLRGPLLPGVVVETRHECWSRDVEDSECGPEQTRATRSNWLADQKPKICLKRRQLEPLACKLGCGGGKGRGRGGCIQLMMFFVFRQYCFPMDLKTNGSYWTLAPGKPRLERQIFEYSFSSNWVSLKCNYFVSQPWASAPDVKSNPAVESTARLANLSFMAACVPRTIHKLDFSFPIGWFPFGWQALITKVDRIRTEQIFVKNLS